MRRASAICFAATLLLCGTAGMANAAFITIGNAGNAADTNGLGDVSYEYKISDTEVTIAEFQASGAGDGDENFWNNGGLWFDNPAYPLTKGTNAPATRVSIFEAMEYCNYLTSGDVNNGAYVMSGGTNVSTDRASALSTYGTIYVLPTNDEWYKAAFYTGSNYTVYAHGTNTPPVRGIDANYQYATGSGVWVVGTGTIEQNGTYDMMGNVWEFTWTEENEEADAIRGGGFQNGAPALLVSYGGGSGLEFDDVGFRVVEVGPQPTTYDTWVLDYELDGVDSYVDSDPDNDGVINFSEYAFGGNPTNDADTGIAGIVDVSEESGTNWFYYVYARRLSPHNGFLNYTLTSASDLVIPGWSSNVTEIGYGQIGSTDMEMVTNRIEAAASQSFIKLNVENQ